MTRAKAKQLRQLIEQLAVTLAECERMDTHPVIL